ncbi:MAG: YfbM family protein, partial [Spirochaetia bacterium]|nr:YfbM family protein [Spirochaetia bacterium]
MIAEYLMIDLEVLDSFAGIEDSEILSEALFKTEESGKFEHIDIDKIWDALHYFLTGVSA